MLFRSRLELVLYRGPARTDFVFPIPIRSGPGRGDIVEQDGLVVRALLSSLRFTRHATAHYGFGVQAHQGARAHARRRSDRSRCESHRAA